MMKQTWTHPQCRRCWDEHNPDGRQPYVFTDTLIRPPEICAWCGEPTRSGIYVREDPSLLPYPAEEDD